MPRISIKIGILLILILRGSLVLSQDNYFEMVFIKGGKFRMGSVQGANDERPVHEVVLDDFYIGKYEVTQQEWYSIMDKDSSKRYFPGCDRCPVERVSWYHVLEFIDKLNQKTGMNYRLPTEAEWEYAARGGNVSRGFKYSGSNKADSVAWTDGNSYNRVHPTGMKKPNELGIYDMNGAPTCILTLIMKSPRKRILQARMGVLCVSSAVVAGFSTGPASG